MIYILLSLGPLQPQFLNLGSFVPRTGLEVRYEVLVYGLLHHLSSVRSVSRLVRTPISLCCMATVAVAMNRFVSSEFRNSDSSRNAYCLCAAHNLISPTPMYPSLGTKNCLVCCCFSGHSSGTTFLPFAGEGDGRNTKAKSSFSVVLKC